MDNFPISNIEDLEQFEKLLIEGTINRKKLVSIFEKYDSNNILCIKLLLCSYSL